MATDTECDHELDAEDAEFLYPSDADVLDIYADDGLRVAFAIPCPDCGQGLRVEAAIVDYEEGDFDLPLDDDRYD